MQRYIILMFLVISIGAVAKYQPLPVDYYAALPEKSMIRVSPSGDRIAFKTTSKEKDFLIVVEYQTNTVIGLVDISDIKPKQAYFIDEDRLIFVSYQDSESDGLRGHRVVNSAFSYNVKTKDMVRLLEPGYGIYKDQTQVGDIVGLSSDRMHAYMTAYTTEATYSLVKTNLDRKRTPKIFHKGKSDIIDFFVNDKDQLLTRERYNNDSNTHKVESLIDDEWKTIFTETTKYDNKDFVGLTPDFKSLIMRCQNKSGGWKYYSMSLTTGKVSTPLFDHKDKKVEGVLSDINRVVHGVYYSGIKPSYEFFDIELTKLFTDLAAQAGDDSLYLVDHTPDWSKIIIKRKNSGRAADYYTYTKDGIEFLATERKTVDSERDHQISRLSFKATDELSLQH